MRYRLLVLGKQNQTTQFFPSQMSWLLVTPIAAPSIDHIFYSGVNCRRCLFHTVHVHICMKRSLRACRLRVNSFFRDWVPYPVMNRFLLFLSRYFVHVFFFSLFISPNGFYPLLHFISRPFYFQIK